MIEIAFTESAAGGLKIAQSFGKGKYRSGAIGVLIHHEDGSEPTEEEIQEAKGQAEERQRREWERAIPLGGRAGDVFNLSLGLGFGDIRDPLCIQDRLGAMKILFSFWLEDIEARERKRLEAIREKLETLKSRIAAGEDARIWYSSKPDELCGFYWLMDELRHLPNGHGAIYALNQPEFEENEDVIISHNGWGEVEPGRFGAYLDLAAPVSDPMRRCFGNQWKELQRENSMLRASINGRLRSAPEDLFDAYIRAELEKQPEEFKEAVLVGNVLGKYQPGIGDGYIHYRIQKMVDQGKLIAVTTPKEGDPGYWRILRKT